LCFSKHIIGLKSQRKILKKQRKNLKKQRKKTIFLCFFLQDLQTTLHIQ
jgi:hypothetical protein